VETFGVLIDVAGLPATEAGRLSLDGARPIEEGALGRAGILLVGGTIADFLDGEGILPTVLGRGTSLVSSILIAEAGRDC
jgi:hypothetical protein